MEVLLASVQRDVVLIPPATLSEVPASMWGEPEKALRALAALNGCAVRDTDARTVEVYRR